MKRFFKIDSEGKIKEIELGTIKKIVSITKKRKEDYANYKYLNIGYYLITPLLISLLLGIYFKKVVFFIFLGTFFVFYNLIKLIKE